MTIDFEDNTGKLVSPDDIDNAIHAVNSAIPKVISLMHMPELAVNLPNILRCLQELKAIREYASKKADP